MKKILLLVGLSLFIIGCGESVEVPPAYVGKVLGKNGYSPETVTPSKFRLSACFAYCDKLILLETADMGITESMTIFMPKDKLNLYVDIRGTVSIPNDQSTVSYVFDRLTATNEPKDGLGSLISVQKIYDTYGKQAVRGVVRSELTKYTIGEILSNREVVSQKVHSAIASKLSKTTTPLRLSRFELANVQPPKVIVLAQEAAKEREIAIQRAEADAKVAIVTAEKDLVIAQKTRLVEKEKALGIAEQNKIAAKSITPQLLAYRRLETAENIMIALASSTNSGLVVVPVDMSSFTQTAGDSAILSKLLGKEIKR